MKPPRRIKHTNALIKFFAGMQAAIQYTSPTVAAPVRDVRLGPTVPELQPIKNSLNKQARKAVFRMKQAGNGKSNAR